MPFFCCAPCRRLRREPFLTVPRGLEAALALCQQVICNQPPSGRRLLIEDGHWLIAKRDLLVISWPACPSSCS
jgi:hypothetical protein